MGVLEAVNKLHDKVFTQEDLEWLSTLGTQAAIAVENARLFAREQQRVRELLALNEVAATVSQSLDLDTILNAALDKILSVVNADAGSFGLLNMRERTQLVDGKLTFFSPRPGHGNGTLSHLVVPLYRLIRDVS